MAVLSFIDSFLAGPGGSQPEMAQLQTCLKEEVAEVPMGTFVEDFYGCLIEWGWILMGFLMGFHGAILVKASPASRRLRSVRFFRPSRPGRQSTSRVAPPKKKSPGESQQFARLTISQGD